jgi:hypothetical protein
MVHSPGRAAGFLLGDPLGDSLTAVAPIAAERDVRDQARASVLADPALGHGEKLGDLRSGEKPLVHSDASRAASV